MTSFPVAQQILDMGGSEACPQGVPIYGVYLVTYLDEDGDECRKWHLEGEPNLDAIMGIVEMFKMRIVADTYAWDNE